jgi:hypothetical protein
MSSQFQNIFENVCRCFGHTPNNNNNNINNNGDANTTATGGNGPPHQPKQPSNENVNSTTPSGSRRKTPTTRLDVKEKQWDELLEKNQRATQLQHQKQPQQQSQPWQSRGQPPRPEGYNHNPSHSSPPQQQHQHSHHHALDHETAKALAQAKLAANPPRYRTKRKRSAQAREEIFRSKEDRTTHASRHNTKTSSNHHRNGANSSSSFNYYTPQTDFSRLLNPSLALCFATPIRGTEEEPEEVDMKSVDNSDTATLNTNGEDTITSTLYFDAKYAHIQESRPPMPLFNQFKIGQAKDEIRTIMATDSHSSLRMIKLMQQQQMTRDEVTMGPEADDATSSSDDDDDVKNNNNNNSRMGRKGAASRGSGNKNKDCPDEEMQDALPDVKAVSSSTDSSRLSNAAKLHMV